MTQINYLFDHVFQWLKRYGVLAILACVIVGIATWQLGSLNVKWLVALFGGLCLLVIVVLTPRREDLLTFLMIAALPFSMFKSFSRIDTSYPGAPALLISTTDIILLLLFSLRAARGKLGADIRHYLFSTPSLLAIGLIITTLPSFITITSYEHGVWELVRMLRMYLLFMYVLIYIQSRREATIVLGAMALMFVGESGVALYQGIFKKPFGLSFFGEPASIWNIPVQGVNVLRATGTFVEPNSFGEIMAILLALSLSLLIVMQNKRIRLLLSCLLILGCVALAFSLSRTGIGVFLLAVGILALMHLYRRRISLRMIVISALVGLAITLLLWVAVGESLMTKFTQQSLELELRGQLNDLAWKMVSSSPISGIGLNNFQAVEDSFIFRGIGTGLRWYTVHNIYLVVLSESGIIGFTGFLAFIVGMLVLGWRAVQSQNRFYSGIGIGLFAGFCGLYVGEFLAFAIKEERSATILWMLWALLVSAARLSREERPHLETTHVRDVSRG